MAEDRGNPSRGVAMLEQCAQTIKDRGAVYDTPLQDFSRTAKMWSAILGVEVTPMNVAQCMIAVKLSRLSACPGHYDSILDIAGYSACAAECAPIGPTAIAVATKGPN